MQIDTAKISSFQPLQMHYFKYLKSRIKFNNFRKKLAIAPFFSDFIELQGGTSYQLGSYTLQPKKLEKLPFFWQNIHKNVFFSHFQ